MAGGRKNRGYYGGGNVSGARVWLEVGDTEDCMVEEKSVKSQDLAGSSRDGGLYG